MHLQLLKRTTLLAALIGCCCVVAAKSYRLASPDGAMRLNVEVGASTTYSVMYKGEQVLQPSPLSMTFDNGVVAGVKMRAKARYASVKEEIVPTLPTKFSKITDEYNALELDAGAYSILFRAYNDGVAYRFVTRFKQPVIVKSEEVRYNLGADCHTYFGKEDSIFTHQERVYLTKNLSEYKVGEFCSPPMIATQPNGTRLLLTEVDLESYGGMYLEVAGDNALRGKFARYALEDKASDDRNIPVVKYADYIAKVKGARSYPWRVALITDNDGRLIESTLMYKLAAPCRLDDTSWIKPGMVAWDWWNANNVYGVDFKSGVNTPTYKYFIDIAAKYGLPYVILDEGWYDIRKDILAVVPAIDIEELVEYGKSKGVGLILWATWKALELREDEALDTFERWGIKGIKIDFMQRDDQYMVDFYYRIAQKAAERKMLVDYHGSYKPTGMHRTYPNVITYEGVKGLENMKWSELPNPTHNLMLPFIRMVAGPMDYTPGGMNNLYPKEFKVNFSRPATLGTRCHQLALYVVYESPLQMIADNPSNLDREPLTMEFLSQVPVTWDETRVIKARVGEYIVVARRKADVWYLGGLTDWKGRQFDVPLDFLPEGNYEVTSWEDGVNVKRQAIDHAKHTQRRTAKESVQMNIAPGGGYVAIVKRVQ